MLPRVSGRSRRGCLRACGQAGEVSARVLRFQSGAVFSRSLVAVDFADVHTLA